MAMRKKKGNGKTKKLEQLRGGKCFINLYF